MTSLFLCAVVFGTVRAHADVAQAVPEVSYLERWAAFSLGSGNGFSLVSGGFHVAGDFGQAGDGKLLMAGRAVIDGDLYDRSNGAVLKLGNAIVTGTTFYNQDAVLDESVNQALAASDRAFSLAPNRSNTSANLKGNARVDLVGLQWNQVLFNVVGPGHKVFLAGSTDFTGILMANNRAIEVRGDTTVSGLIVGNRLRLRGSSKVVHPTIVSQ